MLLFIIKRAGALVATLFVTSFIVFVALQYAPGSPIAALVGGPGVTAETIARVRAQYHLDDPVIIQYFHWISGVLRGDFGNSFVFKESILGLIGPRLEVTGVLVLYATLLIMVFGIALGLISGLGSRLWDRVISASAAVGLAVPSFVAAIVLIAVFAVGLGWFPVFGSGEDLGDRLWHLTLPAIALALSATAYVVRVTRSSIREEASKEHVLTAQARGVASGRVVRRHILRNAAIPIVTVGGLTATGLIAGTVIVESAFGLSGVGALLVQSIFQRDYPVVQAIALILVVAFVLMNLLVDLFYLVLDPRITIGGGQ
ncbi:ABC transporter permease [Leucobacter sp. UCD-THU]|jgi:peptide/nickel transport system permease protein|uniref:ABC transporter permease n=1 Tax=Leucobacter sp. UCD-THU TaxID=1292023 RepID=UPI000377C563|nr:ABC transporter permease [Leucobacter sp. UCD-THU]EYT51773.1 ABC transporter permease [Leucobacter sp. UCD-THU]